MKRIYYKKGSGNFEKVKCDKCGRSLWVSSLSPRPFCRYCNEFKDIIKDKTFDEKVKEALRK